MSTLTFLAVSLLLAPPPATDRGAATVDVADGVGTWQPEAADSPEPADPPTPAAAAPAAMPAPQPMPVPIHPPPPRATGAAPPPSPPPAPRKERTYPDRPIRWRVDLAGHLGTHTFFDPAWRAFDLDRKATHLGASLRGDFRLGDGRVFLGAGATFQRFSGVGRLYDTFTTKALAREPLAFLRLSIVTLEGIDVFVQAGGGASIVDLEVHSTRWASQRRVGALVDGLAGLALYLPKKWLPRRGSSRVTGGLELGLGYTWRSKLPVRPAVDTDDEPIDTSAAPLGTLALHGLAWRFGLFIRFQ